MTPLKATDLRVGNWVTTEYYEHFKDEILVESINDKGINLDIADDGNFPELARTWIEPAYKFEQLRGIPLTEEWLRRAGFAYNEKLKHYWKTWGKNGTSFIRYDEPYSAYSYQLAEGNYKIVFYVHQFQQLFHALTETDLEFIAPSVTGEEK